jgi:hypothetical protein
VQRLQDGLLDGVGEEGILVGRFESPDERLERLLLAEVPVKEAQLAVWDVERSRGIDGLRKSAIGQHTTQVKTLHLVESELDTLDEMKGDGILETAILCQRGDSSWGNLYLTHMSWNRIRESSRALEASPRSTAASMLGVRGSGDDGSGRRGGFGRLVPIPEARYPAICKDEAGRGMEWNKIH